MSREAIQLSQLLLMEISLIEKFRNRETAQSRPVSATENSDSPELPPAFQDQPICAPEILDLAEKPSL
jgi:hypothetical protein